ncbi:hypothetical protein KXD40_006463 [Peronospora effusa]|nr:hypothetical protein KXD40_006463 [Peronospora effusa]
MLRLMENVRVFQSSDDITMHTTSNYHEKTKRKNALQRTKYLNKDTQVDEDEARNLQHFCVLQQQDANWKDHGLLTVDTQDRGLMELIFVSSGEIQARNDGLNSFKRPHFQQKKVLESGNRCSSRLRDGRKEDLKEKDHEVKAENETGRRQASYEKNVEQWKNKWIDKMSRQSRQEEGECRPTQDIDLSLSCLSADDDDSINDEDDRLDESKRSNESEKQEKDQLVWNEESTRQAVQHADEQVWFLKHSVARDDVKKTPTRSLTMDHLGREQGDGTSGQATDRTDSVRRMTGFCRKKAPSSGDISRGARQRPAPLQHVEQVLRLNRSNDVSTRRSKQSPKMEVGHLVSDEPISSPKIVTSTKRENSMVEIECMEKELQKEKRRGLEKTTRLLDEQDKNQQLRERVRVLEARLAAQDSEIIRENRRAPRDHEKQRRKSENEQSDRVNELEEQVRSQEDDIARLEHDKIQLTTAFDQLKKTESGLSSNQRYDTVKVAGLRAELDGMNRRLYEYLTKVERWKSNSMEKMRNHDDKKTALPDLLDILWLDFPQFSGVVPRPYSERPSRSSEPQQQSIINVDEQADVVVFLKKRLREREDKLRQTHIKYMELKEMCARQCVREADLQNFINEHRLRGNLIIRKNSSSKSKGADSNQEQMDHHDVSRRNATLTMTSSGNNNIPASYNERGRVKKDVVNKECSDNHEANDDGEDNDELDNPLQTPNVFVQVGRDRVCEHASTTNSAVPPKRTIDQSREKQRMQPKQLQQEELVERIQCRPSLSLAQQDKRVAQGKKSTQQPKLGTCPSRCGSRPSFMRRKASSTAAQAKRSLITGINRPWI